MLFFAKNIQFLRKKMGLTQIDLTKYIDVTRTTWGNYENNVSEPDLRKLYEIAKFFEVTMDKLLCSDLTEDVDLSNYFSEQNPEQQNLKSETSFTKPTMKKEDVDKTNADKEILKKLNEIAENIEILKKGLL